MECRSPLSAVDGTLACGDLLAGALSGSGEVDLITFTGQAGAVVDLMLVRTGGFVDGFGRLLAVPHATIFGPSGTEVVTFNSDSQNTLTLPESGTYTVRINANTLVHTGSYNLGMECRSPLSAVDGTLACGDLLAGALSGSGEVDLITFTGQAGAVVDLMLVRTGGFVDGFGRLLAVPHATIFGPSGTEVVTFNSDSQNTLTLPESGTYTVRINANTLVHTGSYTLGMECIPPP